MRDPQAASGQEHQPRSTWAVAFTTTFSFEAVTKFQQTPSFTLM